MTPNQTTDMASDVGQVERKQPSTTKNRARKIRSKARNILQEPAKTARSRAAKRPAHRSSFRSTRGSASVLKDAYGMARDSRKKISQAAREAGIPRKYANEKSLMIAAVGLSASVAVGALLMRYGNFAGRWSWGKARPSRKYTRGRS